jgi:hypothetical protein
VSDRSLDLARHATITAPVLRYFGVILQLSAETAVILHLLSRMKRAA